ncbi:MAG: hypothetical protein A2W17_02270 [Planctomycetes bacterium RBG_16_41_13]|nr:MAG: hypothetical protein A2W17_02270 [Planctomycetes bacterium RBG_16_41_13]
MNVEGNVIITTAAFLFQMLQQFFGIDRFQNLSIPLKMKETTLSCLMPSCASPTLANGVLLSMILLSSWLRNTMF